MPLAAILVAYVAVPIGLLVVGRLEGDEWTIANQLYLGEFLLGWTLLALVATGVSVTSLAYGWRRLRWWLKAIVIVLYAPIALSLPFAVGLSIQGFQDYAAAHAAYDGAEQACGQAPIVATDKNAFGGGFYLRPADFDYDRQRYSSHVHGLFSAPTIFFCTEADALANGYRPFYR